MPVTLSFHHILDTQGFTEQRPNMVCLRRAQQSLEQKFPQGSHNRQSRKGDQGITCRMIRFSLAVNTFSESLSCTDLVIVRLIPEVRNTVQCVHRGSTVSFVTVEVPVLISVVYTIHVNLQWQNREAYDKTTYLRLACSQNCPRSLPICEN